MWEGREWGRGGRGGEGDRSLGGCSPVKRREGVVVSLPGVTRLTRSGQVRRQLVTFPGAKGQVGQER